MFPTLRMWKIIFAPFIQLGGSITSLGTGCFTYSSIQTVLLTDNVTSIGNDCFMYSSLEYLSIPRSVTYIGNRAMSRCKRLHTLINEANVLSIPESMCYECVVLRNISFPKGVRTIGSFVISGCNELDYIFIPNTVVSIESGAFSGINATAIYDFEEGSSLRYSQGYLYNSNYTTLVAYIGSESNFEASINSSITEIDSYSFKGVSLRSVTFKGNTCQTIFNYSFSGSAIETFRVVSSIRSISESALYNCRKLRELIFEEGIETVGLKAFAGSAIECTLSIPKSLLEISDYAFQNVNGISFLVFIPVSKLQLIGREAFANTGIASVSIPQSVQSIGWSSFSGNTL